MAFFLKEEREGTVKVSLRSDGNVDVRKFAQRLGGGGHPAASGFRMYVQIGEAEEALAEQVSAYINEMAPLAASGIPGQRER
jgi:phosphoesterase RecJ-like protein